MKTKIVLALALALAFAPTVAAQTQEAGPGGDCSGIIDAVCHDPDSCQGEPHACDPYICVVWSNGNCPLTVEEISEFVRDLIEI